MGIIYKCKSILKEEDCISMYKTFIQPYLLYAIEVWGHTIQSTTDIISRVQSKALRIVFDCKRSEDAWRYNNGRILQIKDLYINVIQKLCF